MTISFVHRDIAIYVLYNVKNDDGPNLQQPVKDHIGKLGRLTIQDFGLVKTAGKRAMTEVRQER
jgi:hypothetical protein